MCVEAISRRASLDAFVVAGNTYPTFSFFLLLFLPFSLSYAGFPGCLRPSWEPFSSSLVFVDGWVEAESIIVFFPFSASLSSFLPLLPLCAACLQTNAAFTTGCSTRLGCCSLSSGSLFTGPPTYCLPLFFDVLSSSPFSAFARALSCAGPSLCTRTRTFFNKLTRLQQTRFGTTRFCSSVVPLHLVLPSLATTHLLSVLSCSSFIRPFCTRMCFGKAPFPGRMGVPPFRAGWRPHICLPLRGVCVCVCPL